MTPRTLLVSILLSKKLVKDVKQTLVIPSMTHFTALKIAVINAMKPGYPYLDVERINMI